MSLYVESRGQGPHLVMLHGWGLHGGIFDAIAVPLEQEFTLHRVDLPGHGRSDSLGIDYTLENVAAAVLDVVPQQAIWLGWSLGGRVAMQAALLAPERVLKLIAVAASPRFLEDKASAWPGVDAQVLQGFAQSLEQDYRKTLNQFLAIQAMGSERAREEIRILREGLFAHGEPCLSALRGALKILQSADLRQQIAAITCPTLFLVGQRDTLMSVAAGELCIQQMANAHLQIIEGAGHGPFISHPEQFLESVRQFIHE